MLILHLIMETVILITILGQPIYTIFLPALPSPNCSVLKYFSLILTLRSFNILPQPRSTKLLQFPPRVSNHSVSFLKVIHGLLKKYASFCTPPESVMIKSALFSKNNISKYDTGSIIFILSALR